MEPPPTSGDASPPAPESTAASLDEGVLGEVLGYQITLAAIAARRLFGAHIGRTTGLRPVDYTVLMLLQANDGVTQKSLGRTLAVSAPKLTLLLDRLQDQGLLTRVRSESDRRAQHLHLTRAGRQLAREAEQTSRVMEQEFGSVLTTAERAMLMELLRKVASMPEAGPTRQSSNGSPT